MKILLHELNIMDRLYEELNQHDAMLFCPRLAIAVLNTVTRPLHEEKNDATSLNTVVNLVSDDMGESETFLLVPASLVDTSVESGGISEKNKFLCLFSKQGKRDKIDRVLQALLSAPHVFVDFDEKKVVLRDVHAHKSCNLLDLCYASIDKRKKRSSQVQAVIKHLKERSVLPEV